MTTLKTDAIVHAARAAAGPAPVADAAGGGKPQDVLTDRERAVAACVGEGLRNGEIAVNLQISEKTVKLHLTRIYRKLGVSSRVKLVLLLRAK